MQHRRQGRAAFERGAAAVEFAIVLPILVLILFGVIDFGLAFFNQIQLTSVAREGVRAAVVMPGGPTASISTRASQAAPGMTGLSVAISTVCPSVGGSSVQVTVAASQVHSWMLLGPLLNIHKTLQATAVAQCN